jgi:outer membrane lipoprotein
MHHTRFLALGLLSMFLAACASAPKPVGGAIEGSPGIAEALARPEQTKGARVRWGGAIVAVENRADVTLVEVVGRELNEQGKPERVERSSGRFIARIQGFIDPEVYSRGRLFTVTGTVAEVTTRTIGDYPYRYPVVNVEQYHLWERERPVTYARPYYDPFYDPWWDPWYPFYRPWPYRPYWP